MVVTIRDVAKRAQVSQATAARALGRYGHVSAAARRAVLSAAEELQYRPNGVARALVSGSTQTIGLIVGDIENPFFAAVARALADTVEEQGYTLLLANSDEDLDRERRSADVLWGRLVDALVAAPVTGNDGGHLRAGAGERPLVLFDRTIRGLKVDSVMVDNAGGAITAVEHLLSFGFREVGVVTDAPEILSTAQRLKGFRRAIADAGLPDRPDLVSVSSSSSQAGGYQAARRLLERSDRPRALFTLNNFMTAGAVRAIRDLGLRIPEDVALIGFDDLDWTTLVDPPITVVTQPVAQVGRTIGERVLARLGGETTAPKRVRLPTELIVRRSCGEAAAALV